MSNSLRARGLAAFNNMRLDKRFAITGSVVMLISMVIIGSWVGGEIEKGVTNNSAISAATYMESVIAPLSQELANGEMLEPETRLRLDKLLSEPPISERIALVKIWRPGGLIAYSSDAELSGKRFGPTDRLKEAWTGKLTAVFDKERGKDDGDSTKPQVPLLEIYSPINSIYDGRVIAVVEFYQIAEELEQNLIDARINTWLIVALITLATFALLFSIVRNGARLIDRQHRELEARLQELDRISRQNIALRRRVQDASSRSSEVQERFLRRISAELHDGPAQALALASLRFGSIFERNNQATSSATSSYEQKPEEVAQIRQALDQALLDIRNLCRGMTLPEIENKALADVVQTAIAAHEQLTGTRVLLEESDGTAAACYPDHSILICVYRFVQECLMNAFRHAQGRGQSVECRAEAGGLYVSVCDTGPGFDPTTQQENTTGIGLRGLRERVESIGGEFEIKSTRGHGVCLKMFLPLGE